MPQRTGHPPADDEASETTTAAQDLATEPQTKCSLDAWLDDEWLRKVAAKIIFLKPRFSCTLQGSLQI
jgi:hypothetical protein